MSNSTNQPISPDEMNIGQRLLADSPKFWKVIGLIAGAVMIICGSLLTYHLVPPPIPSTVGLVASVVWALHNFTAKTPPPADALTNPASLLSYLQQAVTAGQDAWNQGFKPADAPEPGVVLTTLSEIENGTNDQPPSDTPVQA